MDPVEWAPVDAWAEGVKLPFPPQLALHFFCTTPGVHAPAGGDSGRPWTLLGSMVISNACLLRTCHLTGCRLLAALFSTSPLEDLYDDEVTGRSLAVEGLSCLGCLGLMRCCVRAASQTKEAP